MKPDNQRQNKAPLKEKEIVLVITTIVLLGLFCFIKLLSISEITHAEGTTRWYQNYMPVSNNIFLSALTALVPIAVMSMMLAYKIPAHIAALSALILNLFLAIGIWKMPLKLAISSTSMGMTIAIFPILWTLFNSVWIFNMIVEKGFFEIMKRSLSYVSMDRRIQTILIGFGFTSLLESFAAFGAPIAIIVAMLTGFGFPPMIAAVLALLSDTVSSSWGTQSMPIMILNSVTKLDIHSLGYMIGLQTSISSALLPAGLVIVLSGWKGFKGVWPVALTVGLAYSTAMVLTSYFLTPYIVGTTSAIVAILTTFIVLRFWSPKSIWSFPGDVKFTISEENSCKITKLQILRAWSPYILLVLIIGLANCKGLKNGLSSICNIRVEWPGLHNAVWKTSPVVAGQEAYPAVYSQPLLAVGGSLVFFAGLVSSFILGIPLKKAFQVYISTLKKLFIPSLTIVSILGMSYLMNYSAMTYTIGVAFAATGFWFPMAITFLGMLGCMMGGSVAASNALFGNLALVAGNQIGINPVLSAGALSAGSTMGKSIAFQNLVIATTSLNTEMKEGDLLIRVLWISVIYTFIIGLVSMLLQNIFQ